MMSLLYVSTPTRRYLSCLIACICLGIHTAAAEVLVTVGPTSIPRGNALGQQDVTINNGLFAVAVAVDSKAPWGVPRGGIIDIALVTDGRVGPDFGSLADFMPNNWSSWPNTYSRVAVERPGVAEVVVVTQRDWGEVELETRFFIREGDSKIRVLTRMTNRGESGLTDLLSGYVVWPDGGYMFGIPGLAGISASAEDGALADWSAAYDEKWALGVHAPFATHVKYIGRDRYLSHDLAAGESKSFEAWIQVEPGGSLAPLVAAEIDFQGLASGTLSGKVLDAAENVIARPALVVLKNGAPYAWTLGAAGDYSIELPVGEYEVYATAAGHGPSASRTVQVLSEGKYELDFDDVRAPGELRMTVFEPGSGEPLDARVDIMQGYEALIEFFGRKTFFTGLDAHGQVSARLAPGDYEFEVSAGGGFTSLPLRLQTEIRTGGRHSLKAGIPVLLKPGKQGWYSADLHHHSDVLDGFTDPEFVMRSELAANLDLMFLSDHDSMVNNPEMQRLSAARGRAFIPGTELTTSWAHFNAYPIDANKQIAIDVSRASVQQLFTEARRLGADVVHVNHPYGDYGYFRNLENEVYVPGGFDPGFDLVEIVQGSNNQATLNRTWQLWNEGQRAYFAGGSDAHNVWDEPSGTARSYVRIEGAPTVANYIDGLKKGHSFATQGPLIFPQIIFGSDIEHPVAAELSLSYSIEAVSGLRGVRLIERGREIDVREFTGAETSQQLTFTPRPIEDTWYSLVVEDAAGKYAFSNPLWVRVQE
jgi:hypothetical protein